MTSTLCVSGALKGLFSVFLDCVNPSLLGPMAYKTLKLSFFKIYLWEEMVALK